MSEDINITRLSKDDYELLDYTADYSAELDPLADGIATSTWIIPSASDEDDSIIAIVLADGVTVDYSISAPSPAYRNDVSGAVSINGNTTTVFIDGGTLNAEYRVMNRITTTDGRHYSRVFDLAIARQGE